MIAECILAIKFGAGSEDIARTIHGHPTFAEAMQEAAMAVQKCSIYGS
jgi:dihydrolipoamide dehydrogenase